MGRSENGDRFSKNADRFQKNADRFFSMEACWRKSCRTFGKVVQLLKKLYGFSASALLSELKKHALAREARRMCEGYVKVSGDGKVEGLWRLWNDPSPPECRCTGDFASCPWKVEAVFPITRYDGEGSFSFFYAHGAPARTFISIISAFG